MFSATASGANYYWIGGAGSWSDINHWRTTSGGANMPNVIPGPTDDVFFDANSGFTSSSKTVSVNVAAYCRNLTVSETTTPPTLSGTTSIIFNIYGSVIFQEGMSYSVYNTQFQNTDTPKTITSNGVKFGYYVYFKEKTSITLLDEANLGTMAYINNGTLITNNNKLYVASLLATGAATVPSGFDMGSSDIYVSNSLNFMGAGCKINAGTSTIHFTSKITTNTGLVTNNAQTYYNIIFEHPESSSALVSGNGTFNKIEFKGSGYINGDVTAKEVIFNANKLYRITADKTLKVTERLSGGLACGGWMTICSATEYLQANISVPASATVDIDGAVIKDINAIGGANFTAHNSIDNGNNSGWSFPVTTGKNLYWVGGEGEWSDSSHWSTTSGGVGGSCVPGPEDNVYFDAGSGFTNESKTINLKTVSYCKDIICSGSSVPPELNETEDTSSLNIYGSSEWQEGMTVDIKNINYQNTNESKTIKTNGVQYYNSITIKETGTVDLLDNLSTYNLSIEAGTFNTNNFDIIIANQMVASKNVDKVLNLGSSQIYFNGINSRLLAHSSFTTINAGTSHIHFTGALTLTGAITGVAGQKYYDVSIENPNAKSGIALYLSPTSDDKFMEFNKIEMAGHFITTGNIKAEELYLGTGNTHTFESARKFTINKKLVVGGICQGWTTMKSSTSGSQAIISMPATAAMEVNSVLMKDLAATGGANFVASNSIDQGNNTEWDFSGGTIGNLYWVGGSGLWGDSEHWANTSGGDGGACVPGPSDNVFFDANSGFTSAKKTVTVVGSVFCRNITVAGTTTPPTFTSSNTTTNQLNIYGSSVWQAGMAPVAIYIVRYVDTKIPKTITTNGVVTGSGSGTLSTIYFAETTSISMVDDFRVDGVATLEVGTFNTNDHKLTIGRHFIANSANPKTLNLGKSDVLFTTSNGTLNVSNSSTTINAKESNIVFSGTISNSGNGLKSYAGQEFNNVSFTSSSTLAAEIVTSGVGEATFNKVEIKGGGKILGNNTFNELSLLTNKKIVLGAFYTQTIKTNLNMSGTTCDILPIESSSANNRAKLNVLAGNTSFNFINMKDVDAIGLTLHFGAQSTISDQNNNNVTYDPYDPGHIEGLGEDRLCQIVDDEDPKTYTIGTDGFYGNEYTQYSWKKVGSSTVIGTEPTLDFRPFGSGEYTVDVAYSNGTTVTCRVSDNIIIKIAPTLSVQSPLEVCIRGVKTHISDVTNIAGTDIRWYANADKTTLLPSTTEIIDGSTFYLTQTVDGCESAPVEVHILLVKCNNKVYINPSLRTRASF